MDAMVREAYLYAGGEFGEKLDALCGGVRVTPISGEPIIIELLSPPNRENNE
jgi:hypothetical protein